MIRLHKIIGKIYVISILFFASPSGLFMSFHAIGGLIGTYLFSLLSILWFIYTFRAYLSVKRNQIEDHKHWIIGSFILTNSALLLRINNFVIHRFDLFTPTSNYLLAAFLSWVPLLIIHEIKIPLSRYMKS